MIINKKTEERFFSHTEENKENGCLEWTIARFKNGYGKFHANGKTVTSHRIAWVIKFGPIPNGLIVCHSCDNPKCVNWKHLWLGTHLLNAKDRMLKKRNRKKMFTPQQEEEIATTFFTTDTTAKELAQKYNTSRETISSTISQKHFREKYGYKSIKRALKITHEMHEEMIERFSQGESTNDLAKSFNITPGAIRWHLKIDQYRSIYNKSQKIRRTKLRLKKINSLL